MLLNRPIRFFLHSTARCLASEAAPSRTMAPQFQFLTSTTLPSFRETTPTQQLLTEVLRCRAYLNEPVYANVLHLLSIPTPVGQRTEANRLVKMQYIAVVYHAIRDEEKRKELRQLAEKVERCKISLMRNEQELFFGSLSPSDHIPDFQKCLRKNDLVFCYLRRELESGNWHNVVRIVSEHPIASNLSEHVDQFLRVAELRKVNRSEVLEVFMNYTQKVHPFYIEKHFFESFLKNVFKFCSAGCSEFRFDGEETMKKTFISEDEVRVLKDRIDEYVKKSREGLLKWEEYTRVTKWVQKQKVAKNQNVVVVDALNYGKGTDPVEWKCISRQFDRVLFATRTPPIAIRQKVLGRYAGSAVFCDKLSADDLLILRMALECGPRACILTNDQYRDHRLGVCNRDPEIERIWDTFMVDAVYRHDIGPIEPMRNFNLRVRKLKEGEWLVPTYELNESTGGARKFKYMRVSGETQRKKSKNRKR